MWLLYISVEGLAKILYTFTKILAENLDNFNDTVEPPNADTFGT